MADAGDRPRPLSDADAGASVEGLSRVYRPALVAYFRRRAYDRSDAEDMAHEVFVRMLARGGMDGVDNPQAFLFQTAANLVRDQGRRRAVREAHLREAQATEPRAEDICPERVLQDRDNLNALMGALDELTEKTRDIFLLRRLERLKVQEIADLYGISVSAVEKHVAKALAHIKTRTGR